MYAGNISLIEVIMNVGNCNIVYTGSTEYAGAVGVYRKC